MVAERSVEGVGQVMQGGDQERGAAAGRVADLQPQDRLGRLRGERAVLALVVAERLQGAVDGRHGELRAGVERAGALAGVAGPHEVELAGGDHPLDQPGRLASIRFWYSASVSFFLCLPTSPARTTASLAQRFAASTASR